MKLNLQVAQSGQIKIHSIQIDNQLLTSSHPVVLAQTAMALRHKTEQAGAAAQSGGRSIQQTACLELTWEMLSHNPSILYFRHLALSVAPWDVVLEEDFLDRILQLVRSAPLHDFWQLEASSQTLAAEKEVGESLLVRATPSILDSFGMFICTTCVALHIMVSDLGHTIESRTNETWPLCRLSLMQL